MRKIVMDVSIILIVACLIGFVQLFVERSEESSQEPSSNSIGITEHLNGNSYVKLWEEVLSNQSTISFPTEMISEFSYFYNSNDDMAGWLRIDDTNLDVQVVQGDNNEYYLNKDFYKKDNTHHHNNVF